MACETYDEAIVFTSPQTGPANITPTANDRGLDVEAGQVVIFYGEAGQGGATLSVECGIDVPLTCRADGELEITVPLQVTTGQITSRAGLTIDGRAGYKELAFVATRHLEVACGRNGLGVEPSIVLQGLDGGNNLRTWATADETRRWTFTGSDFECYGVANFSAGRLAIAIHDTLPIEGPGATGAMILFKPAPNELELWLQCAPGTWKTLPLTRI